MEKRYSLAGLQFAHILVSGILNPKVNAPEFQFGEGNLNAKVSKPEFWLDALDSDI